MEGEYPRGSGPQFVLLGVGSGFLLARAIFWFLSFEVEPLNFILLIVGLLLVCTASALRLRQVSGSSQ